LSSSAFNAGAQSPRGAEWAARLIPGVTPVFGGDRKKVAQSVKAGFTRPTALIAELTPSPEWTLSQTAALLLPCPPGSRTRRNSLRLVSADFAFVTLNWLLVGAARSFVGTVAGVLTPSGLLGTALLHAALITLIGHTQGLYSVGSLPGHARALGKSVVWATALLSVAYFLQGAAPNFVALVFVAALLHFAALFAWRWGGLRHERSAGQRRRVLRNVLIVGAGGLGRQLAAHLEHHPEEGRAVCGLLDDKRCLGNGVIGRVCDLARLARTGFVDEVLLAAPHDRDLVLRVLHEARRLRLDVEMVPDLFGCRLQGTGIESLGNLPVICLHQEKLPAAALLTKRALDVIASIAALFLLAPLLAMIAGLIKLDSSGRVLYAAQRAGRKGCLFRCYKFRTMVSNAEDLKKGLRKQNQRSGPIFKIAGDPRITRMGRLLRRYSLDELPQLWNVLRGEMSLVGPRPHPLDDFAAYEVGHLARLDVTPGITGLWQVTARRDPSFQRSIELDCEYIRTWSLRMDARILLKTVKAVLRGSGD
jgi:exopolysaccharide biosynthesis polyprenyl glycosylphosphotransferase